MVETAHQLYERLSQNGAPALTMMETMMENILIKMFAHGLPSDPGSRGVCHRGAHSPFTTCARWQT
jgi:hypothetical protein